jgi:FMN phosphatase YigB (HAD superfamily)
MVLDGIEPARFAVDSRGVARARLHLGGISNADDSELDAMVTTLGVREIFHHLLSSETARCCKPHPAIFQQAPAEAGCAAAEAVFVGDTPATDMAGAAALGMRTVLIEDPTDIAFARGRPLLGQLTISELPELLDLIGEPPSS